jgi:peptidoglycan hydrolase-like protein with peptidoglycan-binding domain
MMGDLDSAGPGASTIKASVGVGGVNARVDVLTIQQLLNGVAPDESGPLPLLAEDGFIGPLTNGAIRKFQQGQQLQVVDGRIDPDGPTLRRLNEVSTPGQRAIAQLRAVLGADVPAVRNLAGLGPVLRRALRLKRAERTLPDLIRAGREGQRVIEQAMDHVALGASALSGNAQAFRKADFHFRFGNQPQAKTVQELSFIRTTFRRVNGVINNPRPSVFGGNPFGVAIFDIDPTGKRPDWRAYTPTQKFDGKRKDGVTSGHVYLCDQIDFEAQDLFAHILLHELFHFVDDESKERRIADAPDGYREGAFKLAHEPRMHNADNYALFTSHVAFGRMRLIASQPTLAPVIPQDMT